MRKMKRIFALMMIMILAVAPSHVLARGGWQYSDDFDDVDEDHWARDYIELMTEKGIINGYGDGSFRPSATVSRAEFAKMLVATLGLDLIDTESESFLDVDDDDWEHPFVETAKFYLTGYRVSNGYEFRPDQVAVREDMAVAVVKGLNIDITNVDESVLNNYNDSSSISTNLRKYVAAAINEGIMIGSDNSFNAQSSLTRAEAATLLARLIMDEKVVFDEDNKVVMGNKTPTLIAKVVDDEVVLEWTKTASDQFDYYKVAISKDDDAPRYPDVGSFVPLSGVDNNRYVLESGLNHGGLILEGGEDYYVAITAVYKDGKYTSNVLEVDIPGEYKAPDESGRTPTLSYSINGDEVILDWSETSDDYFQYYKIVLSQSDSTPSYPDNGYAKAITDHSDTDWVIKSGYGYNSGDLGGKIKGGTTYYMAITAVYSDGKKYTSNVVQVTVPGTYSEPSTSDRTPVLTASTTASGVQLSWTKTDSNNFKYYKVVLSKNNATPAYPTDGYLTYISDANNTSYFVQEDQSYNGGDFGGKVDDETYYMTITAVYNDGKYTSNTVVVTVPDK